MYKRFFLVLLTIPYCNAVLSQNVPNNSVAPNAIAKKLPAVYTRTAANYVRQYTALKPTQDTAELSMTALVEEVSAVTTYADGYGRPVQTVARQMSPSKKDNVSAALYDEFGRPVVQYMPFASTASDGAFKTNPFFQDSAFYKNLFPNESINYSQVFFDGSPFNLPTKSLAPGNSWGGSNVGITPTTRANRVNDSVVLWTITNTTEDDMPVKWGYYAAGSLLVQQVTNEVGIATVSYTDNLGRTVLTKTQTATTPTTGHAGWLCTYYVYDEMGRVRVVIPPKGTETLNSSFNFSASPAVFSNLCFVYFYDSRSRQVMKRIPGKGKSYIAYDLFDRVVMTQDPKLRLASLWAFVLYDNQSRPDTSGIIASSLIKDSVLARAGRSMVYPPLSLGAYTLTSINFYDDYSWVAGTGGAISSAFVTTHINSTNFITTYNTSPAYAQQPLNSNRVRGAVTGNKKIILGTGSYLYTLQFYDDNGRPVQTKQTNYSGGINIATVQYSFAGSLLRSHLAHQKSGVNPQTHTVLYKYTYDHAGRPLTVTHKLDALAEKTVTQYTYNELGQVTAKNIGGGTDVQNYTYNIRGWLTSINKDFVSGITAPLTAGGFFGETISYDFGFTNNQLTGNIAGTKWKSAGDTVTRAYGYTYDNIGRLTTANYSQAGTGWVNNVVDYTTSNLGYDANGNILTMKQRGLLLGSSSTIDSLTYQYAATSNVLQKVIDGMPAVTGSRGDFQDTALAGDDYLYDANGNIVKDNNRHMHSTANANGAVFNVLDKPDTIGIAGRSGTQYFYDAGGSLLKKQVNKYGAGGSTKTYLYTGGFVYMNDTLQYALHNEGSVRYTRKINSANGAAYYAYEYDYYIKDRQGNIRTVLTEGRDTAIYQATTEPALQTYEDSLFSNIYSPTATYVTKPAGFDTDGANTRVIKLNSGGNKTAAGLTLKVMAGDKIQVNCYAYYNTATQPPAGPSLLNDILGVLSGGVVDNSGGKVAAADQSTVSSLLNPNVTDFLNNHRTYDALKPKAYLNWILFDNQFKYIQGGVVQVLSGSSKQVLGISPQTMSRNGYLYVYVSNESPQDVYFDDVTVKHYTGPLVQEQSYYPFGLQMAAISDKAIKKNNTPYKYNDGSELEEELNYYNTFFRKYDAQIGRFTGIDILGEETAGLSPYHYGGNNPVFFNDPSGARFNGGTQKGPDGNYHVGWMNEQLWNNIGFYDWGGDGDGGGGYFSIQGYSSNAILNQMNFGDRVGRSSKGVLGIWQHYAYSQSDGAGGYLNTVAVGSRWSSFLSGTNSWSVNSGVGFGTVMQRGSDQNIREAGFFDRMKMAVKYVWNSRIMRTLGVRDKYTISLNIHGFLGGGGGTSPLSFTLLTRGNDAGLYFTPSVNGGFATGSGASIGIGFSSGVYTGDVEDINSSMLNGHTFGGDISSQLWGPFEGSIGGGFSPSGDGHGNVFVNVSGSIGMGLESPKATIMDQYTIQGTVQSIFKF